MTTPETEHVSELVRLADHYEKGAAHFRREKADGMHALFLKRAAAIRWLLSLTGYPVDEQTPT